MVTTGMVNFKTVDEATDMLFIKTSTLKCIDKNVLSVITCILLPSISLCSLIPWLILLFNENGFDFILRCSCYSVIHLSAEFVLFKEFWKNYISWYPQKY